MFCTGWTALFLAAHKNNTEVTKFLCYSQANVDFRCEDGRTAVSVAVQTGKEGKIMEDLISFGF